MVISQIDSVIKSGLIILFNAHPRKLVLSDCQEELPQFLQKTHQIRIQYPSKQVDQQLHSVKTPAKVKSPALVEWTDPVSLPLLINQEYRFEVYEMHQFGYNPEELSSVAIGKFTISNDETFSTWEVTSDRGNKLGFLSAKIRRKLKYVPNVTTAKPEVQILSISSIISSNISIQLI